MTSDSTHSGCEPTIRTYRATDHAAVSDLYYSGLLAGSTDFNDTAADLDFMEEAYFSQEKDHFWVAECEGQVVGCVGLVHDGNMAQVRRLRVAPRLQETSLAVQLLDTALKHCRKHGALKVVLDTRMDSDRAIALLQTSGFQFSGGKQIQGKEVLEFYFNIYRKSDPSEEPIPAGSTPLEIASGSTGRGGNGRGNERIRVLLVDDHRALRDGLKSLFEDEPDIEVVGEASDGEEAVVLTKRIKPDLVIMDVTMPRMNGIEATRVLSKEFPRVRVIGLSMHEKHEVAKSMLEAGASAYLPKDVPSRLLLAAIRNETSGTPAAR